MADLTVSNEERELLRTSMRRVLAQQWPIEGAPERSQRPESILEAWRSISALGVSALGSDRSQGGLRELILVFEEMGRASCPVPLLGAVLTNFLLGDDGKPAGGLQALLPQVREGSAAVAVGFGALDGDRAAGDASLADGRLCGRIAFVENVQGCSALLVFLRNPSCAVILPSDSPGVEIELDPGLAVPSLAAVTFRDVAVPADRVLQASEKTLSDLVQITRVCCVARAIGAATRGFELAVEHAKTRKQFGQLIGQFQAIQHKLANCLTNIDGARLTLDAAATAYDLDMADWRIFAASSIARAGPSLRQTILEAHHVLAAVGYAEEHELPRHFRRIHADVSRFGGVSRARAELADYLLGPVTV